MTDELHDSLADLIEISLRQWRRAGDVVRDPGGTLTLTSDQHKIAIERAADGLPFRWIVYLDGRQRVAASVVGVLRIIRQSLSAGYAPGHVTIAPLPPAPQ